MSESPDEQPSTGVLGRIGGWLSPWKGKGPQSPSENDSPTSNRTLGLQGEEEESGEALRSRVRKQEERVRPPISPKPRGLSRDATQSNRRDGPVAGGTGTAGGGPTEAQFAKKRIGQGRGREESSNGTSVSENARRNASHLTHPSSTSKQDTDRLHAQSPPQDQTQTQAQTGKNLHWYLEETSVIPGGQDTNTGRGVVCTEIKKGLQVLPKSRASSNSESPKRSGSPITEKERTNVSPVAGTQSYYSTLVGVSLKPRRNSQPEAESVGEQAESDSMGRKNSAKRKFRKNSQGDAGKNDPQETPPKAQPAREELPTSDNFVSSPTRGKSPKTHMGESPVDSSLKLHHASQGSADRGESGTSCPDTNKRLDHFQHSNSAVAAPVACVVDGGLDMEEDDSFYTVERKTETPESKRRSLKVSRSEVKLFTKYVPLNPKENQAGDNQDSKTALKNTKDDKDKSKTQTSIQDLKKIDEEPKTVAGRIADKISLFERPAGGLIKKTLHTPRSADVSPIRKTAERTKLQLSDQRSRSADRYNTARSGTASPIKEKKMTVKERARNIAEASIAERPTLPPKPATTATSPSKSQRLGNQGKLDTKEQTGTTETSEITPKPDEQDTIDVGRYIPPPKEQLTDSKTKDTVSSRTVDQATKPNSDETDVLQAKRPVDSGDLTNDISPQSKSPSRPNPRPKRRKSRELTSPISPTSENKPFCSIGKPETLAIKQEKLDDTKEASSLAKQLPEKDSLASDKAKGNRSDKQPSLETKQKAFRNELKVLDGQKKQSDSSLKKENISKRVNRQEVLPDLSVNKDEPDTAAYGSATNVPTDKDPTVLPQTEEHSNSFTKDSEKISKESAETSASAPSPAVEQPTVKASSMEQEPPVEKPESDQELSMQSKPKNKVQTMEQRKKDTGQTHQPQNKATELLTEKERKDTQEIEKVVKEKTHRLEKKGKGSENTQQTLSSDINTTKAKVSDSEQGPSQTEGKAAKDDERKKAQRKEETHPVKSITITDSNQADASSEKTLSDLPAQKKNVKKMTTTDPQKAAVCANIHTNEAVRGTLSDKGPLKEEAAMNVSLELKTTSTQSARTEKDPVVIAAQPWPNSVSLEQKESSQYDSSTRGANDAEPSSPKPITKTVIAVEEVAVKAVNDSPAQNDNTAQKESSGKEPNPIYVSKSVSGVGVGQGDGKTSSAVKSMPSEENISGDIMKVTTGRPQHEKWQSTERISEMTLVKGKEKTAQRPSGSTASNSTFNVLENTAEKTIHSRINELSPVANGDISLLPQLHTVKKEPVNSKPSQKSLTSPEGKRSPLKKLPFPRGLSKDDSATLQDAPSSWLDLDFPKEKLKLPAPRLSSSGSENNLLDTSGDLDDDDFIEKIKKLCAPFSLPPRKHNPLRTPQPPFALPAIREDRFEKTFDPEEFMFGLSKKNKFCVDTTPSHLAKLQKGEPKSGLKPARASLADRSMLLSSLDSHSRLRDKAHVEKDSDDVFEDKDEQIKVRSRLEGSCVFSHLSASNLRAKRNGDGTNSGDVSPTDAPQRSPPSLTKPSQTATASFKDLLVRQGPAPSNKGEAQAAQSVVSDSNLPFPSFNDTKLPDYLEKYLPRETAKPMHCSEAQEQVRTEVFGNMTAPASTEEVDMAVKPGQLLPDAMPPRFPGIPPTRDSTLTKLKQPAARPQAQLSNKIRTAKGFHKRPGKIVLFEEAQFSGQVYEIYRDITDATSMRFSPFISVKVIRGCWMLYEKPGFQGRCIALEEGGIELENVWAEPGQETQAQGSGSPMLIGSIRLAVWDYSIPHIDLFTEPEGHGRVTPYHDDTIETGSFGVPVNTASIRVHSGVWLVYSDHGFEGMIGVLEPGEYPFPEAWGFPSPFIGSLRPLKMGGFKVENPSEVKVVVFEKPGFEGYCLEIDSEVFSFCDSEEENAMDAENPHLNKLKAVGSLKIIGGLWVGYSQSGFEGQQHILEEGEYLDCSEWGGSEELLSLRPILGDFMSPHVKMFSNKDLGDLGVNIDFTVPMFNMEDTGYGCKTQSIDVISGIWVVFEEPGFCGESYILEKGLYGNPEDWGALQPRVASVMPVVVDDLEYAAKFKVQLFSEPSFQGSVLALEDSMASLQDGFHVASCKVLAGSWLGFEGQDFTGRSYVLEVGSYPDLRAMGCFHASSSVLSLQTIGYEFSLPSITLFERSGLRGKRVVLTDGLVNLQQAGGCSRVQSVLVEGGMWVLYEEINYRGTQILLKPGEVPDWHEFSSWRKIGSLRPLIQKQVYFSLRNRQTGLLMSVTGDSEEVKLLRVQELEETGGFEQIWSYQDGHLHCKMLEDCCLGPSGTVIIAGCRVGFKTKTNNEVPSWSITPEGFIRYTSTPDLVLEVKGGNHYDKNQVILNTLDPNKLQQRWDVEII